MFKKEGDVAKGVPYWEITKKFIEFAENNQSIIFVSTINLKEIKFKLGDAFSEAKQILEHSEFIRIIATENEDYDTARKFEQLHEKLSFYDYLHVAIAKRLGVPLITRDKQLIEFAQHHIEVFKPEDLIG